MIFRTRDPHSTAGTGQKKKYVAQLAFCCSSVSCCTFSTGVDPGECWSSHLFRRHKTENGAVLHAFPYPDSEGGPATLSNSSKRCSMNLLAFPLTGAEVTKPKEQSQSVLQPQSASTKLNPRKELRKK